MLRLSCLLGLALIAFGAFAMAPTRSAESFRLDRRVPWTTSRVVGSPDAPPPFRTRRVFEKFTFKNPVYLISHPAHDLLFVVEQNGRIVSFPPSGKSAPKEFLRLKDAETYSMTFHPKYATNHLIYVFSHTPKPKHLNQVHSFKVVGDPPQCDPASRKLIIEWESNGHNGGDMAFGPDGMFYITSGDGTSDSDTNNTGQDIRDLNSGMIRIDVDRPAKGMNYSIPPDNPFLKVPGARGELWAFGFRNPWRMTFHPRSGELLVGDVGQDWYEMIQLVTRGSNHGWSVMEGSHPFQPLRKQGPAPIVPPLIEHPHSESRSITGGLVYQGKKYPTLRDVYVYADYSTGKFWGLKLDKGKISWKGELANSRSQTVGIGADRDGELYIVDYAGQIHQFEPTPVVKNPPRFPRLLSETGIYQSVKEHHLHPGLIPYSVNSPLWSDGAFKERAFGLPGGEKIGFTEDGPWDFPEKTVLVKTFSVDREDGRRQRIETRLLTLQDGEWVGYSYAWKDDQSDAELVEASGKDKTYTTRTAGGEVRKLNWRYPSRVECMVCHTRAAKYVLGLSTAQLNREHDYGTIKLNQIAAMERLGVLRINRADHWKTLQQRGQVLSKLTHAALPWQPLSPFRKSLLEPFEKAITKKVTDRQRKVQQAMKNAGTVSVPAQLPEEYPVMPDPMDKRGDLTLRVKSYLQSNCAHCHVWAGGGNSAIDLHWKTTLDKMKLVNVDPLHDRFGIKDAKLVAPGSPERSVLYQRLTRRGKGQMPPLATTCIDENAAALVKEWIEKMR